MHKSNCVMIILKKVVGVLILLLFTLLQKNVTAQYYYRDVLTNLQQLKEFTILKNENLRTIVINSFENDGSPSDGFSCQKKFDKNFRRSEMFSNSNVTGGSILITIYNDKGQIIKLTDSAARNVSHTSYQYDNTGKIKLITIDTKADDEASGITETREYQYSTAGKPEKMVRKKLNKDYSVVNFVTDEKGNISEEREIVGGKEFNRFYYYYDDRNRLTDIVHFNNRIKKLLPDFMFEYNTASLVKQMIATEAGTSNYSIWTYSYNDLKLRETEKCYSKQRRLIGSVTYQYK
ncbi:hypothetical protein BH09BAC2_BH09BAC2_14350 [soil metagenome]